ncbi:hypothetical protein CIPAW_15G075300 [Carya illinoinensis]|uniref:Uncharacterized protein n=1 Tax=Carya illinoinensis TaxID=32201 RepID=A0A8T1N901_CARIL|nr:hypothetical protein CIPAW_15G075300 [Carya illinoinensis]
MHDTVFKIVLVEIILAENFRDTWQSSLPPWEKKLCSLIGSVPWKRLVETKKCNIINSLPCDISLPDPNIYSEEVEWNPSIDTELFLDLVQKPMALFNEDGYEEAVVLGDSLLVIFLHWIGRS